MFSISNPIYCELSSVTWWTGVHAKRRLKIKITLSFNCPEWVSTSTLLSLGKYPHSSLTSVWPVSRWRPWLLWLFSVHLADKDSLFFFSAFIQFYLLDMLYVWKRGASRGQHQLVFFCSAWGIWDQHFTDSQVSRLQSSSKTPDLLMLATSFVQQGALPFM